MRTVGLVLTGLSAIALGANALGPANAQSWPTQTVKIVTPFPPGSGGDVTARPFAERLAKRWSRPVIVENRPGADGIVAVTSVLNSSDGHTILYTNGGPLTSNQISHGSKLPYDPMRDLAPISCGAEVFVGVGVPAVLSIGSIADFVKLARSRPGQLNWGATPGSLDYLIPGFFRKVGLDLTRVPYRDVASAMQDLSQARLHFYVAGVATQLPMAQTGTIRIIAVTNKVRAPSLSDVPTADEAGFQDLRYEAFLGFFGPRTMAAALREQISADVRESGADEELAKRFNAMGMKVRVTTPGELERIVADERAALARMTGTASSTPAQ
jgi:tripartite-type tricarboxylate transporter receptor subunit TctC